ncbi:mitochondrial 28S ribosomal protein s32 domain-containing protein [Ditylenchus destructor]|uniref:Mitochondrial 28S ribosomal protein s32 domain-containing protein n=1 Tax=Ditylenchus destructor TaxID=166010 RepID=A0AAD4NG87_9BILA|nr:mitochondrial 28S ribosomal protein s32 domain-containing protein [Ditylenchus destructor]
MLKKAGEKAIVVCSNGMVAAWHPKQPFPYEHSRPIDINDVNMDREKYFALLNGQRNPKNSQFGKDGPRRIDLREMFYTVSQEWCPRYRETRLYQMCAPIGKRK